MKNKEALLIKLISFLFFIVMLLINYTKQSDINAISQLNKPLIQPIGFTFSIWSVIYFWLFVWFIYSFFKFAPSDKVYASIKYALPLNFTLNALWVLTFTNSNFLFSCICISGVLVTITVVYFKLKQFTSLSWLFTGVFSIYLSWISIATIVNIYSYLNKLTPAFWNVSEQLVFSIIALILMLLFSSYMLIREHDVLVPLTTIWSFIGIALNKASTLLSIICYAFSLALFLLIIYFVFKTKNSTHKGD